MRKILKVLGIVVGISCLLPIIAIVGYQVYFYYFKLSSLDRSVTAKIDDLLDDGIYSTPLESLVDIEWDELCVSKGDQLIDLVEGWNYQVVDSLAIPFFMLFDQDGFSGITFISDKNKTLTIVDLLYGHQVQIDGYQCFKNDRKPFTITLESGFVITYGDN